MTFKKISMAILSSVILQPHLVAQFPPEFQICPNRPGPPSRVSYFSRYVTASGQQRSRGIRFELYPNGIYLITKSRNGANKTLWGTLNTDQLGMFAVLANRLDFGGGEGVYRSGQGLEYFEAGVWNQQKTYVWVNPEHLRPFPNSVVNIINWLQSFTAEGAIPIAPRRGNACGPPIPPDKSSDRVSLKLLASPKVGM